MTWFSRLRNWQNDQANGIGIRSDFHDQEDDNFAAGINLSLNIAGNNTPTANIPMGGFKFTGAADGTAASDFATYGQSQVVIGSYAVDSSGSDAYAVTLTPAITAYTAGLMISFKVGTSNTGAATLNVNALGAKTIKKDKDTDLATNDLVLGQVHTVRYDGTNFQLQSPCYGAVNQNGSAVYAADSGAANAYVVTLSPVPAAYATGMIVRFKATNANTGTSTINVNALGLKTIKKDSGVDLLRGDILASQIVEIIYDGTNFQLVSPPSGAVTQNGTAIFAADAGATDAYAITLSPAISAYTTGMIINFKANTENTGAATLNVNGLGAITIKKSVSTDLGNGDILANQLCSVIYDGTNFQMNSLLATAGGVTNVATAGLATGGPITGNGTITVTAATQADMETATSTTTAVTPAVVQNHPGVAKAAVRYNGVADTTTSSYNISGVVRNGTGDYTFSFTVSFSNTNYSLVPYAAVAIDSTRRVARAAQPSVVNTGSTRVLTSDATPSAENNAFVNILWFGDQ